jgi:hypothetical protein
MAAVDDLGVSPDLTLDWSGGQREASLQQVFSHVTKLANDAIEWYIAAKNTKRVYARAIRMLAILLGAVAALLPTVSEIVESTRGMSERLIPAGWTAVLLGIVGALLLLDRFFGFSTGWMRYIRTELQLRQIAQEFQLDWEAERSGWQGSDPTPDQTLAMLARCKAFVTQVNTIVRDETTAWVEEFESTLRQIDESAKARPAVSEPGALNLSVTNGDASSAGWKLSLDGLEPEKYTGRTAAKRNLVPGRHLIKVTGEVGGKAVQAEKVITVPAGGTCEESLVLS